ncbi:hypothetical protein IT398_00970 [Candidatus Nomurabacteria bacterium]|nr:hypothetical protein [Candidatus Nomurabacteria bacterium]
MSSNRLLFVTVPSPDYPHDLHTSNVPPPGVELDRRSNTWHFRGGSYDIGSSVRTSSHGEILEGLLFVYDPGNPGHREKLRQIKRDLEKCGQLAVA